MLRYAITPKLQNFQPRNWADQLKDVNRELWLLLSLFVIAGLLNWCLRSNGMMLALYTLPTLFSAFSYGKRHAVMTALASVLLVGGVLWMNPALMISSLQDPLMERWLDVTVWGGLLIVTAYAMGTLYDRKHQHLSELRRTYFGVLTILQKVISTDAHSHNHSYRVAEYAAAIAARMRFTEQELDDIRAAALLHEIGKLECSRELLEKAACLDCGENGWPEGAQHPTGSLYTSASLSRIVPVVLAYQDGGECKSVQGLLSAPLQARILAVADSYDTLTSDRPYRRAITPFEAKDVIIRGAGSNFDKEVVEAFVSAFNARSLDLSDTAVLI